MGVEGGVMVVMGGRGGWEASEAFVSNLYLDSQHDHVSGRQC